MATLPLTGSRQDIVANLREQVRRLEGMERLIDDAKVCSTGCLELDRLLPAGGFPRGALVEWLAEGEGSGAGTLAWLAARAAITAHGAAGGVLVVLDRQRCFYPPAAAAGGVELDRVIVVRAGSQEDELWACDQALRCEGVAVVWGALDAVSSVWFRRLQLAAESGGGRGYFLRPARVRGEPTWSYAQWNVRPVPRRGAPRGSAGEKGKTWGRRWRVELARCQGMARGGEMEVELDEHTGTIRETSHEAHPLYLAHQLAYPTTPATTRRRSAGA